MPVRWLSLCDFNYSGAFGGVCISHVLDGETAYFYILGGVLVLHQAGSLSSRHAQFETAVDRKLRDHAFLGQYAPGISIGFRPDCNLSCWRNHLKISIQR